MEQAPHPPYSPDLAPSDFYLFGYLKDRLQGQHFEDGDQLFDAIIALTGTSEKATLRRVLDTRYSFEIWDQVFPSALNCQSIIDWLTILSQSEIELQRINSAKG
jgi:hypothetical protein